MSKIEWGKLPFDHSGRWEHNQKSIMNPGAKCSWPQLIAEWVLSNRAKLIKTFPTMKKGPGWSSSVSKEYRAIIQQAYTICNYFPHPEDDNLVYLAFKNTFLKRCALKIGQFRKVRVKKDGTSNITDVEKDVVKAITCEYDELKERTKVPVIPHTQLSECKPLVSHIKMASLPATRKGILSHLLEEEKQNVR